jgi:hypothetical protein
MRKMFLKCKRAWLSAMAFVVMFVVSFTQAFQKGWRSLLSESPELFCKVPTDEIGIFTEIILIHRKVMVGKTAVSPTGTLYHRPHALLCTSLQPRITYGKPVMTCSIRRRQRQTEHHIRTNILGNHLNDTLRIRRIPSIDMHNP